MCGSVCEYEEVSLALPDESPDGKHNYLPHCLPIISAGEVQVTQLKLRNSRSLESHVPEVKSRSRAASLPQLSAGPSWAPERAGWDSASVSLPYRSAHPAADGRARGENWRKRKREEVLTLSCSRLGPGWSEITHHQLVSDPVAPQKESFGPTWPAGVGGGDGHMSGLWPRRFRCLLKLRCGGKALSLPSQQTGTGSPHTGSETRCFVSRFCPRRQRCANTPLGFFIWSRRTKHV